MAVAFQAKAGGGGSGRVMLTENVDVTEPVTAAERTLAAVVLTAERMRTVMEKRTLAAVDRTWVQKERLLVTGSQSEVSVVSMSAVEPVESVAVVLVTVTEPVTAAAERTAAVVLTAERMPTLEKELPTVLAAERTLAAVSGAYRLETLPPVVPPVPLPPVKVIVTICFFPIFQPSG